MSQQDTVMNDIDGERMLAELMDSVETRVLVLADLQYGPYQRDLTPKHLNIADDFSPIAFRKPLVGERDDGSLWCVDGLQRIAGAIRAGVVRAPCDVFASTGVVMEATLFDIINGKKTASRLNPGDHFRAALARNDPVAISVKRVADEEGFTITYSRGGTRTPAATLSNQLACISTLTKCVDKWGEAAFQFSLYVIRKSWPEDPRRTCGLVVGGLTYFYHIHKGNVDPNRLILRLQDTSPTAIMQTVKALSSVHSSGDQYGKAAEVVAELYRKRKVGSRKK